MPIAKNSSLLIFDGVQIQTDVISSREQEYYPLSSLSSGGPIEFYVPGNSDDYIDCDDINLYLQVKIEKAGGKALVATEDVTFANFPIGTLFQDASLTLGETHIEGGHQCYPYIAYLNTFLNYKPEAQDTHLKASGWSRDEAGKMDAAANTAHVERLTWTDKSRIAEFYGPLHLDFLRHSRYLISQVPMRLKLVRSKPEFALLNFGAALDVKIEILHATLHVRRVTMNPSVINGHNAGLARQNALYPVNHTELFSFTIPAGQKSYIKDRISPSQTPKFLAIMMVTNEAFNGDMKKNPFNFQHFNLNKIQLFRDTISIPGRAFTPDFGNNLFLRGYINTMKALQYYKTDDTNGLTPDEFKGGYAIYAFDLTADNDVTSTVRDSLSTNNLRLELSFEANLAETVNVLMYAVYDSTVQITQQRDVLTDYSR